MPVAHLAFDLGASSGRAIIGVLDDAKNNSGDSPRRLALEEVHRFDHLACPTPAGPVWDLTGIWQHMLTGLDKAATWCKENQLELKSVGVDTWGVDWTLVSRTGEVLMLPHCYRDPQNEIASGEVLEKLGGFEKLYNRTGIQLMPFNTLFQVAARYQREPKLFDAAHRLLFLPDLLHFWLSGEMTTERTIASTSSMLDIETGEWDFELISSLGLPTDILGPIVDPGTPIGTLRPEVAELTGASPDIQIILPPSHDTASAVAAVPATGPATKTDDWAYLSSGTWSLLGIETNQPINSEDARKIPLTNERGVQGTVRLLKNIAGLWLVQELRRELKQQGDQRGFTELVDEARLAEPYRTLVDPNHAEFAVPGGMTEKLRAFARNTDQPDPETVGQLVRCCLDSLALCYGATLDQLETVLNRPINTLHIVGGGIQNRLLSEITATVIDRPVITGPVEATAIGNLLVQALGCGELANLEELRQVVAQSFKLDTINADSYPELDSVRDRFQLLVDRSF